MERHIGQSRFTPLGHEGQARIARTKALLVGVGAIGSALAEGLVRAGIGELILFDRDLVDEGNLSRQCLYSEADLGRPKAEAACRRLTAIDSRARIRALVADVQTGTLEPHLDGVALILDGSDNFETRFLINDLSLREGLPWIYSAAIGETAVSMPILPGETACLECLYPEMPENGQGCGMDGLLHAAVLAAAAMSLAEALKILSGHREALIRMLRHREVWSGRRASLSTARSRSDCGACGGNYRHLGSLGDSLRVTGRCADACHVSPPADAAMPELAILAARWPGARLGPYALEIPMGSVLFRIFPDGQALAEGSGNREDVARLYRRIFDNEVS